MVVRKTDVSSWRVRSALYGAEYDKPISSQKLAVLMKKAKADKSLGPLAVDVIKLAYRDARAKGGKNPTRQEITAQIDKVIGSLANERKKGRINDGYVDQREAAAVKGELAAAMYKFLDVGPNLFPSPVTPAKDLARKATTAQIDKAVKNLMPIIDKGVAAYDPDDDDDGDGMSNALRKASNDAGLSSWGRAAILTALNGATSRSDWGEAPSAADIKFLLTNAQTKLKSVDGAQIVDFASPDKAPKSKKDGVTTGLELDRTPSATGMTSRAVLAYAATL